MASESNNAISIDITIGVVVISVGAIIYIGRLLLKRRRRKRKDLEKVLEPMVELEEIDIKPKKTAADHLGELKEATQKVLQPLRLSTAFTSPKESSVNLSSNLSSGRSSSSSSRIYDKFSFTFKLFKVPPPPPPTPLISADIKVDPIRMSLLNLLLTDESENTSLMSSPVLPSDLSRGTSTNSLLQLPPPMSKSQPELFRGTNSNKDLSRKASHPDLNLLNSNKDLSRKASHPDLNLTNSKKDLSRKASHPDLNLLNLKKDLSVKISHPDLNLNNSKKDLSRKASHPDLNLTNSKKDLSRKTSHPDLNLTNSKRDLSRKTSNPDLNLLTAMTRLDLTPTASHSKRDLLPQLDSSETRPSNDLTFASRKIPTVPTVPQLDSTIPSETLSKKEITRTRQRSNSKVRSRRSHRRKHSHSRRKETNDYTNFQPIQNIKPIQNGRSEKRTMATKITKIMETEVGELTLSPPMYSVKPFLKESQDDEIILDATFGMKGYANK